MICVSLCVVFYGSFGISRISSVTTSGRISIIIISNFIIINIITTIIITIIITTTTLIPLYFPLTLTIIIIILCFVLRGHLWGCEETRDGCCADLQYQQHLCSGECTHREISASVTENNKAAFVCKRPHT